MLISMPSGELGSESRETRPGLALSRDWLAGGRESRDSLKGEQIGNGREGGFWTPPPPTNTPLLAPVAAAAAAAAAEAAAAGSRSPAKRSRKLTTTDRPGCPRPATISSPKKDRKKESHRQSQQQQHVDSTHSPPPHSDIQTGGLIENSL